MRCSFCGNTKLIEHTSNHLSTTGLSPSEAKQVKDIETIYYRCGECIEFFLFFPFNTYHYRVEGWVRVKTTSEKVIFT